MPFKPGKSGNTTTQFKPGQSGNPAGPGKGYKHINTIVQELLNDEEFETLLQHPTKGWVEFKGAPVKAIVKAQMLKALGGDTKAYDSLMKSGYPTRSETDLHVKELPKPLLGGISAVSGDNSNTEDIEATEEN